MLHISYFRTFLRFLIDPENFNIFSVGKSTREVLLLLGEDIVCIILNILENFLSALEIKTTSHTI